MSNIALMRLKYTVSPANGAGQALDSLYRHYYHAAADR